jgi:hypothetical protein
MTVQYRPGTRPSGGRVRAQLCSKRMNDDTVAADSSATIITNSVMMNVDNPRVADHWN